MRICSQVGGEQKKYKKRFISSPTTESNAKNKINFLMKTGQYKNDRSVCRSMGNSKVQQYTASSQQMQMTRLKGQWNGVKLKLFT